MANDEFLNKRISLEGGASFATTINELNQLATNAEVVTQVLGAVAKSIQSISKELGVFDNFKQGMQGVVSENQAWLAGMSAGVQTFSTLSSTVKTYTDTMSKVSGATKAAGSAAQTAGTTFSLLGTAIPGIGLAIGAASIAVGAFVAAVSAAEARKKKIIELGQEVENLSKKHVGMSALVAEFEALESKGNSRTAEENQRMLDIRHQLVESYGLSAAGVDAEGRLLAGNLEIMKEQLQVYREMAAEKAKDLLNEKGKDFKEDYNKYKKPPGGGVKPNYATPEELKQNGEDFQKSVDEMIQQSKEYILAKMQASGKELSPQTAKIITDALRPKLENGEDISSDDLDNIIDKYLRIDGATAEAGVQQVKDIKSEILAIFAGSDINDEDAKNILDKFLGPEQIAALESQIIEYQNLEKKISDGTATESEKSRYQDLGEQIQATMEKTKKGIIDAAEGHGVFIDENDKTLSSIDKLINQTQKKTILQAKDSKVLKDWGKASQNTNKFNEEMKENFDDLIKGGPKSEQAFKKIANTLNDIGEKKSAIKTLRETTKGTDAYNEAMEKMKKWTGLKTDDEVLSYLDSMEAYLDNTKNSIEAYIQKVANANGVTLTADPSGLNPFNSGLDNTASKILKLFSLVSGINGVGILFQTEDKGDGKKKGTITTTGGDYVGGGGYSGGGGSSGGGGGGGTKENTGLNKAMDKINHKKAMDKLTYDQEIKLLKKAKREHAKTAAERKDIDEQIYALKKEKFNAILNYKKSMGKLSLDQEIARLDKQRKKYKKGTQARMDADAEWFAAKQSKLRSDFDMDVEMGKLSLAQQVAKLKKLQSHYKKGTQEYRDFTLEIAALEKEMWQANVDHKKAMDQMTTQEEIAELKKRLSKQKAGTEEYKETQRQIYEAEKNLRQQQYDLAVYYGQMTLEEQLIYWEQASKGYKKGTDAQIDAEKEAYRLKKEIRDRDKESLNKMYDGVMTGLKAKYDKQKQEESDRIQASIDEWKKWGDEQSKIIQDQIKLLDDEAKAEDRTEQERQKRRKIAMLEQQLQYEQDAYNRLQIEKQLVQAQDDLNKWLRKNERDDLKESLKEQENAIKETVSMEEEKLKEKQKAMEEYYKQITTDAKLRAEAEELIAKSSAEGISDFLNEFAPEFELYGYNFGEKFVDAFTEKFKDIEAYMKNLNAQIENNQKKLAQAAVSAIDTYYETPEQSTATKELNDKFNKLMETFQAYLEKDRGNVNITFEHMEPTSTQFARDVEKIMEAM